MLILWTVAALLFIHQAKRCIKIRKEYKELEEMHNYVANLLSTREEVI